MEHSMSQYVNKDEMLKAVMAEKEQLRAQLAATQQGVQPDVRACIRAELENWHIESGDVSHYEALTDSLVSALKRTTHHTTQGLEKGAPKKLPQRLIDQLAENHGLDCFTYTPFARALEKEFIATQAKQGGAL